MDRRIRRAKRSVTEEPASAGNRAAPAPLVVVVDAPLLVEKQLHERWCDVLVFVDAPRSVRQARARADRGWSAEQLDRRDAAQVSPQRKKRLADFVIDNRASRAELEEEVRALVERITKRIADS